jgi:ABC-type branched-subunit amino acid transport system substrate-binding protein
MTRFIAAALVAAAVAAAPGRNIYFHGTSSAPIKAVVNGDDANPIPATVVPCVNCHGYDGRGKKEGGIAPADLRWSTLTKAYTTGTRTHGPYTKATLRRAFTMGFDPAGNALDPAMPRYQMSMRDAEDLVAYLQTLGTTTDPGVAEKTIRIGVLLSPDREKAAAVRDVMQAYAAALPEIYGRRLELRFLDLPADASARAAAVQAFLAKEQPFALAASSLLGAENAIETAIEDSGTPSIAAFAASVLPDAHDNFALFGDVTDAIRRHDAKARIFDGKDLGASGRVYVPMTLASEAIFAAPPSVEVIVAAPTWTDDVEPDALAELRALSPGGTHSRSTQMAALASAKLLVEGLRRAGHDVTREAVIETIESLYRFRTGLTPPLSFGPNRHAGTSGAFLLRVDREAKALRDPQWIE